MGELYRSEATGLDIYRHHFEPEGKPRGTVLAFHGLGDHLGTHELPIRLLTEAGYRVYGIDWPGNGHSEGKRGHFPGACEAAMDLIEETIQYVQQQEAETAAPDLKNGHPFALYAHSTGGFYTFCYLDRLREDKRPIPFDWIWLSSPLLHPDHGQAGWKKRAARWIARRHPSMTFDTKVRVKDCRPVSGASPKELLDLYNLCHHRVSAELGADLMRRGKQIEYYATALTDPTKLLITQGAEDDVCPPIFTESVFEHIQTTHKEIALIEGQRHEPFNSPETGAYEKIVRDWLGKVTLLTLAFFMVGCAAHRELKRDIESVVDITKAVVDFATLEPGAVRRASYYEDLPKPIRLGNSIVESISIDHKRVVLRDGTLRFGRTSAVADRITWSDETGLYHLEGNPHLYRKNLDVLPPTAVIILDRKGRPQ